MRTLISTPLLLPWPPTINTYWRRVGKRTLLSKKGREYKKSVKTALIRLRPFAPARGSLGLQIVAHAPDKRKRDLDNLLKAPLDALEYAKVFLDDFQIDAIQMIRGDPVNGGRLLVMIEKL